MVKLHIKGQFINVGDEGGTPFDSVEIDETRIVIKVPFTDEVLKQLEIESEATLIVFDSGQEILFYTDLINFNKATSRGEAVNIPYNSEA